MKLRNLHLIVVLAVVAAMAVISGTAQAQPAPPNILLIQVDDLGYGDLSVYGQERFETPSLDRLASEGIRFTQYYAGSTVCAPSRAALMTARTESPIWSTGGGD